MNLIALALLIVYGAGSWKFWSGFKKTTFHQNRLLLTLGWPLFLISPAYRQNFNRALKG